MFALQTRQRPDRNRPVWKRGSIRLFELILCVLNRSSDQLSLIGLSRHNATESNDQQNQCRDDRPFQQPHPSGTLLTSALQIVSRLNLAGGECFQLLLINIQRLDFIPMNIRQQVIIKILHPPTSNAHRRGRGDESDNLAFIITFTTKPNTILPSLAHTSLDSITQFNTNRTSSPKPLSDNPIVQSNPIF